MKIYGEGADSVVVESHIRNNEILQWVFITHNEVMSMCLIQFWKFYEIYGEVTKTGFDYSAILYGVMK